MVGIYRIVSPTNKIYIGQSWNIESRIKFYSYNGSKNQRKLNNSFKKYEFLNHKVDVLFEFKNTPLQKEIDDLEIYYISFYKALGFDLLNIKEGGSNGKHSIETKLKMSEKRKGIKRPDISIANKNRVFKDETILKHKSRKRPDVYEYNKTRKFSEKTLMKMRERKRPDTSERNRSYKIDCLNLIIETIKTLKKENLKITKKLIADKSELNFATIKRRIKEYQIKY